MMDDPVGGGSSSRAYHAMRLGGDDSDYGYSKGGSGESGVPLASGYSYGASLGLDEAERKPWCRRWGCTVCVVLTVVVLVAGVLTAVFVGGKAYADAAIRDSDIDVTMAITVTGADTVTATIAGTVHNGAVFGATMETSTVKVMYQGKDIGSVVFPETSLPGGGSSELAITSTMYIADPSAFTSFAVDALHFASVDMDLVGTISVHAAGITFEDISLSKTIALTGFSNFTTPPPSVVDTDITRGTASQLFMTVTCDIPNYSSMSLLKAGRLTFDVLVDDVFIGVAVSDADVSFLIGPHNIHTFSVTVTRSDANADVINRVVSNYTSGRTSYLTLQGTKNSTKVKLLQDALSRLSIVAPVPGLTDIADKALVGAYGLLNATQVLGQLTLNKTLCSKFPGYALYQYVTLFTNNRFTSPLTLTYVDLKVLLTPAGTNNTVEVGYASRSVNIVVPPKSKKPYKEAVCLDPAHASDLISALLSQGLPLDASMAGYLQLGVTGTMVGTFGDFANAVISYNQSIVPTAMTIWDAV